jgi:hypothetical protein
MMKRHRGSSILTRILISGFDAPIIVTEGKKIKHWCARIQKDLGIQAFQLIARAMEAWREPRHIITNPNPEKSLSPAELGTVELPDSEWFEEIDLSLLTTRMLGLFDPPSSPDEEEGADPIRWHTF